MDDIEKQSMKRLERIAALSSNGYGTLTQPEANAALSLIVSLRGRVRDLELNRKEFHSALDAALRRSNARTAKLERVAAAADSVKQYADGVGECAVCDRGVEECDGELREDHGCLGADIRAALAALGAS